MGSASWPCDSLKTAAILCGMHCVAACPERANHGYPLAREMQCTLLYSHHTGRLLMATEDDKRLDNLERKMEAIDTRVNGVETAWAVSKTHAEALQATVTTGFADLKETMARRATADAEERKRVHELAVQDRADSQARFAKIVGIITTLIGLAAAGGGGAYYAMDGAPKSPPVDVSP